MHERKRRAAANLAEIRNKNVIDNNVRISRNDGKLIHLTDKKQKSSPDGIASFSEPEDDVVSEIVMGYD